MKKLFVVLLALCLFVMPAMAQTKDEPEAINWEDLEKDFNETGYGYEFYDISEHGFKIMIPNGLEPTELSQKDIENGFVRYFATEDQSVRVLISYRNLGCETLADLEELITENVENAKIAGYYIINGLDALIFLNPADEDLTAAIGTTEPGYFIQVSLEPVISNEEINKLSGFIFGSIQPLTEEE